MPRVVRTKTFSAGATALTFLNFDLAHDEIREALPARLAKCDELVGLGNIARQTFFVAGANENGEIERAVAEAYPASPPPTSVVFQPPADGCTLSAELWAFPEGGARQELEGRSCGPRQRGTVGFYRRSEHR